MSRRGKPPPPSELQRRENLAFAALTFRIEREVDGFTREEFEDYLVARELTKPQRAKLDASFAISYLRRELGDDVLVYSRRTGRYRTSITADEAFLWIFEYLRRNARLLGFADQYVTAAATKYPDRDVADAHAAIDHASYMVDHALRQLTKLLG